jgi:hypothetical protein
VLGALPLQQLFSRLRRDFDATEDASRLRDVCYLFGLYALVNLFAMHGYTLRCREAEAQLITLMASTMTVMSSPIFIDSPGRLVRISIGVHSRRLLSFFPQRVPPNSGRHRSFPSVHRRA